MSFMAFIGGSIKELNLIDKEKRAAKAKAAEEASAYALFERQERFK